MAAADSTQRQMRRHARLPRSSLNTVTKHSKKNPAILGFRGAQGPAAPTCILMGARVPILSPNDHRNPTQRRQKDFGKNQNLENCQVPLKCLKNSNLGFLGGSPRAQCGMLSLAVFVTMSAECKLVALGTVRWPPRGGGGRPPEAGSLNGHKWVGAGAAFEPIYFPCLTGPDSTERCGGCGPYLCASLLPSSPPSLCALPGSAPPTLLPSSLPLPPLNASISPFGTSFQVPHPLLLSQHARTEPRNHRRRVGLQGHMEMVADAMQSTLL